MFVLSYNVGSLLALAVFAGVTFRLTGITQVMTAGRVREANSAVTDRPSSLPRYRPV